MIIKKLIEELQNLCDKGYGDAEVFIMEQMFSNEKPYNTTVENIVITKSSEDKEKDVILLLR